MFAFNNLIHPIAKRINPLGSEVASHGLPNCRVPTHRVLSAAYQLVLSTLIFSQRRAMFDNTVRMSIGLSTPIQLHNSNGYMHKWRFSSGYYGMHAVCSSLILWLLMPTKFTSSRRFSLKIQEVIAHIHLGYHQVTSSILLDPSRRNHVLILASRYI